MSDSTPLSHHRCVRESTDDSTRLALRGAKSSSRSCYHANYEGEPACGVTTRHATTEYVVWPVDRARAWRDPCSYCFPNGDST